jgi:hypothetical protein
LWPKKLELFAQIREAIGDHDFRGPLILTPTPASLDSWKTLDRSGRINDLIEATRGHPNLGKNSSNALVRIALKRLASSVLGEARSLAN